MERKVFCIIVTYNAMKWVDKCLGSLYTSTQELNVIVVDNGSSDGTLDYIANNFSSVQVIANESNVGFGQANNLGIEIAYNQGATHFFLLNQDAWIESNTITTLCDVMMEEKIAIASPMHLNGVGDSLDYNFCLSILNAKNTKLIGNLYFGNLDSYYYVPYVNAASWMLSRNAIEKIGGFDPLFFHYGEDSQYCKRVLYHGMKIVVVPCAIIHHDRIVMGNQNVYNKYAVRSLLLYTYSDITISLFSFAESRLRTHAVIWSKMRKSMVGSGNAFLFLKTVIIDYFSVFSKIPSIVKSRRNNKKIGAIWLSLSNT